MKLLRGGYTSVVGDHDTAFTRYREHLHAAKVTPIWTKRCRSLAIAAFKAWNGILPNGKEIISCGDATNVGEGRTGNQTIRFRPTAGILPALELNGVITDVVRESFAYVAALDL